MEWKEKKRGLKKSAYIYQKVRVAKTETEPYNENERGKAPQ